MIYLYGWNSVSEFIMDELENIGSPIEGVVVDDPYTNDIFFPHQINIIPASIVHFKPDDSVFNCIGYKHLDLRVRIGQRLADLGVLRNFISIKAQVHRTASVGTGSVLLGDVVLERNCDIGNHCLLWGGSRVCHDSVLGNGVFLAAGSIIGGACTVGNYCSLGFNSSVREKSTLTDGIKVGANRFWKPSQ